MNTFSIEDDSPNREITKEIAAAKDRLSKACSSYPDYKTALDGTLEIYSIAPGNLSQSEKEILVRRLLGIDYAIVTLLGQSGELSSKYNPYSREVIISIFSNNYVHVGCKSSENIDILKNILAKLELSYDENSKETILKFIVPTSNELESPRLLLIPGDIVITPEGEIKTQLGYNPLKHSDHFLASTPHTLLIRRDIWDRFFLTESEEEKNINKIIEDLSNSDQGFLATAITMIKNDSTQSLSGEIINEVGNIIDNKETNFNLDEILDFCNKCIEANPGLKYKVATNIITKLVRNDEVNKERILGLIYKCIEYDPLFYFTFHHVIMDGMFVGNFSDEDIFTISHISKINLDFLGLSTMNEEEIQNMRNYIDASEKLLYEQYYKALFKGGDASQERFDLICKILNMLYEKNEILRELTQSQALRPKDSFFLKPEDF